VLDARSSRNQATTGCNDEKAVPDDKGVDFAKRAFAQGIRIDFVVGSTNPAWVAASEIPAASAPRPQFPPLGIADSHPTAAWARTEKGFAHSLPGCISIT
jgi:hypothetical protein